MDKVIRVTSVQITPGSTVATAAGEDVESGEFVSFAGDWRPMLHLAEALADGQEVVAEVPLWAMLYQAPAQTDDDVLLEQWERELDDEPAIRALETQWKEQER
jgi:hypothetical protein